MRTGSKAAIADATRARSRRAAGNSLAPHTARLGPNAIQVAAWRAPSSGIRYASADFGAPPAAIALSASHPPAASRLPPKNRRLLVIAVPLIEFTAGIVREDFHLKN